MKPWLWLPPKLAHDLSPYGLAMYAWARGGQPPEWRPLEWRGLKFPNRLGVAGGVDKDGAQAEHWWSLGAGFLEIGTVTPLPQDPNPGRIMDRSVPLRAVWNKMGFPSSGAIAVAKRLERLHRPFPAPLFINIGKNRTTPNEKASSDYVACVRELTAYADAFVVNISSPNTTGLRDLLAPDRLRDFLAPILEASKTVTHQARPVLLKLSPDLNDEHLRSALDVSCELGIDGWIVSNTTLQRSDGSPFPNEGGVSGAPLAPLAKEILGKTLRHLGARRDGRLVISVGGVMSAEQVRERLEMGADLVQVYSALVFNGPGFFRGVAKAARHWQ